MKKNKNWRRKKQGCKSSGVAFVSFLMMGGFIVTLALIAGIAILISYLAK